MRSIIVLESIFEENMSMSIGNDMRWVVPEVSYLRRAILNTTCFQEGACNLPPPQICTLRQFVVSMGVSRGTQHWIHSTKHSDVRISVLFINSVFRENWNNSCSLLHQKMGYWTNSFTWCLKNVCIWQNDGKQTTAAYRNLKTLRGGGHLIPQYRFYSAIWKDLFVKELNYLFSSSASACFLLLHSC